MLFCNKCGAAIEPDASFCNRCGEPRGAAEQQPNPVQWQPLPAESPRQPEQAQWQQSQSEQPRQPDPAQWRQPQSPSYPPPEPPGWQQPQGDSYRQPYPNAPPPPQYQYAPPYQTSPPQYQPSIPMICPIFEIYRRVMTILKRRPILLWGISLMFSLLNFVAVFFCVLPIIYVPVIAVLEVGMISVFLAGYRGAHFETAMLFSGFNDFKRIAGGMLWMSLWILIWGLIPFAGVVMVVIKGYSYRFVPYLLLTDKEVKPTDTLKMSMGMTKGYRGKMFGADILVFVIVFAASLILGLMGRIPAIGGFFYFLLIVLVILCAMFLPLFAGLIKAAFFDEIERVSK